MSHPTHPPYPPQRGHGHGAPQQQHGYPQQAPGRAAPQHGYPQATAQHELQAPVEPQQDYAAPSAEPEAAPAARRATRPPAPAPKRRRRWPWVVGIVVAFLVGIGVGGAGDRPTPAAATSTPQLTPAAPAQAAAPVEPGAPAPSGPATTVGDGTYEVGVDLEPGRYKTAGPDQSSVIPMCYFARRKDDSGEVRSIIANDNLKGPGSVTVKAGEFVEFSGGCTWAKS